MADHDDMNIQTHQATYAGVISLLFWGAIAAFAIGALVIWLIAPGGK